MGKGCWVGKRCLLITVLKGRGARKNPGRDACHAALQYPVALRLGGKVILGNLLVEPVPLWMSQRQTHSGVLLQGRDGGCALTGQGLENWATSLKRTAQAPPSHSSQLGALRRILLGKKGPWLSGHDPRGLSASLHFVMLPRAPRSNQHHAGHQQVRLLIIKRCTPPRFRHKCQKECQSLCLCLLL